MVNEQNRFINLYLKFKHCYAVYWKQYQMIILYHTQVMVMKQGLFFKLQKLTYSAT